MNAQLELFVRRQCRNDLIIYRDGRVGEYMGGFDTGGGCFQQIAFKIPGSDCYNWITLSHKKFQNLFKTGEARFVKQQPI